eukprot:TRINITY_DN7970_c0_g1_i7.p1 TRINITY_DN7970_c0_g1~~TRINITY_DN7970_c0_g1_i7.p1  ORF type:complete len:506 (-),score=88.36 TRINITY_DN7970_c0_g1_i7:298-1815(-)
MVNFSLNILALIGRGGAKKMNGGNSTELSVDTLNPKVVDAEYAVRGAIVQRAYQIQEELKKGSGNFPFEKTIACNIGNPQSLGQPPIQFYRQVLALCDDPQLIDQVEKHKLYPSDVIARAREYLAAVPGGTGAYSKSNGADIFRKHVAEGIEARDGHPADPNKIFLVDGASAGVHQILRMLLRNLDDGVLIPIPQYPLYSACMTLYGGTLLPYYLDEQQGWGLNIKKLQETVDDARKQGKCVRALVVINPGNPTGQVLELSNQQEIIKFCKENDLILMADEVYQENIYAEGKKFYSFKKVLIEMGEMFAYNVPLVSYHSTSKGFYGECGRRGGFMELVNFPEDVMAQLNKLVSINLCPNLNGQTCTALMMKPPKEGEPSFELYNKEKTEILESMKRRAKMLTEGLNKMEGVTCNEVQGALYAFPRITLSQKAIDVAREKGVAADFMYCMQMLEQTGVITVPGSGFGQEPGTFHFRLTILPPEKEFALLVQKLADFHKKFLDQYRD